MQLPAWHAANAEQTLQVNPPLPHAALLAPVSHVPLALQHPEHVAGLHGFEGAEQLLSTDNATEMIRYRLIGAVRVSLFSGAGHRNHRAKILGAPATRVERGLIKSGLSGS
jgi:hypothetical protein